MRVWWIVAIAVLSLTVGVPIFWGYDAQNLVGLVNGITAIAAVLFGVLGVWMSVLRPADKIDASDNEPGTNDENSGSDRTDLALDLVPAFKQSIAILVLAALFRLVLIVVPLTSDRLSNAFGFDVPTAVEQLGKAFSGVFVIFLYLFVIIILIASSLPLLAIEKAEKTRSFNHDEASSRPRSRRG